MRFTFSYWHVNDPLAVVYLSLMLRIPGFHQVRVRISLLHVHRAVESGMVVHEMRAMPNLLVKSLSNSAVDLIQLFTSQAETTVIGVSKGCIYRTSQISLNRSAEARLRLCLLVLLAIQSSHFFSFHLLLELSKFFNVLLVVLYCLLRDFHPLHVFPIDGFQLVARFTTEWPVESSQLLWAKTRNMRCFILSTLGALSTRMLLAGVHET